MPNHTLKSFCVGRDPVWRYGWNDDDGIADLPGIPAISADNPKNVHPACAGFVETRDDIGRNISFCVTPSDRKDKNGIVRVTLACPQIGRKNRLPPLIIGPGCQFGDIIDRGVGFDSTQFSKIVYRMAAIRRAATNTNDKKSAATRAQTR